MYMLNNVRLVADEYSLDDIRCPYCYAKLEAHDSNDWEDWNFGGIFSEPTQCPKCDGRLVFTMYYRPVIEIDKE